MIRAANSHGPGLSKGMSDTYATWAAAGSSAVDFAWKDGLVVRSSIRAGNGPIAWPSTPLPRSGVESDLGVGDLLAAGGEDAEGEPVRAQVEVAGRR